MHMFVGILIVALLMAAIHADMMSTHTYLSRVIHSLNAHKGQMTAQTGVTPSPLLEKSICYGHAVRPNHGESR